MRRSGPVPADAGSGSVRAGRAPLPREPVQCAVLDVSKVGDARVRSGRGDDGQGWTLAQDRRQPAFGGIRRLAVQRCPDVVAAEDVRRFGGDWHRRCVVGLRRRRPARSWVVGDHRTQLRGQRPSEDQGPRQHGGDPPAGVEVTVLDHRLDRPGHRQHECRRQRGPCEHAQRRRALGVVGEQPGDDQRRQRQRAGVHVVLDADREDVGPQPQQAPRQGRRDEQHCRELAASEQDHRVHQQAFDEQVGRGADAGGDGDLPRVAEQDGDEGGPHEAAAAQTHVTRHAPRGGRREQHGDRDPCHVDGAVEAAPQWRQVVDTWQVGQQRQPDRGGDDQPGQHHRLDRLLDALPPHVVGDQRRHDVADADEQLEVVLPQPRPDRRELQHQCLDQDRRRGEHGELGAAVEQEPLPQHLVDEPVRDEGIEEGGQDRERHRDERGDVARHDDRARRQVTALVHEHRDGDAEHEREAHHLGGEQVVVHGPPALDCP